MHEYFGKKKTAILSKKKGKKKLLPQLLCRVLRKRLHKIENRENLILIKCFLLFIIVLSNTEFIFIIYISCILFQHQGYISRKGSVDFQMGE